MVLRADLLQVGWSFLPCGMVDEPMLTLHGSNSCMACLMPLMMTSRTKGGKGSVEAPDILEEAWR